MLTEAGVDAERARTVRRVHARRIQLGPPGLTDEGYRVIIALNPTEVLEVAARGRAGVDTARAALLAQMLAELEDSAW